MELINREALIKEIKYGKHPEFYDGQNIANWQMQCIENALTVKFCPHCGADLSQKLNESCED